MRSSRRILLTLTACALAASDAGAQTFNYPNFSSTTGLTLLGSAAVAGNVLRVAPASASQIGAAWYTQPMNVVNGFTTTITFSFTSPSGSGADGLALVLQNDPRGVNAIGTALQGSAIGYGDNAPAPNLAIKNSLVLEIDTYDAGVPWNDPSGDHFSWHTNGTAENAGFESQSIGDYTPVLPQADFTDGFVHTIEVAYVPGTLSLKYDGISVLSTPYNFTTGGTWTAGGTVGGLSLINGNSLYVGITGATGGVWENNDVISWSFTAGSNLVTYCTAGTSSNGCNATISADHAPSVSLANSCNISITSVEGQKNGIIFYGINQMTWTPTVWANGSTSFLCVKAPSQRTGTSNSGGTLNVCNGVLALNWNNYQAAHPSALGHPWAAGSKVFVQGWYRDPPAPKTTNLSNALEMTYVP